MLNKERAVFLLGGKDLEMQAIRDVLVEKKIRFEDADLSWENAKLSAYRKVLNNKLDKIFYAVELEIDNKKLFKEYDIRVIDHHGEKYHDKPASLLQVLELLGKKPTREQKLIAVNDARYIGGMECLGATTEEIKDIRRNDRRAQGVTESDEVAGKNDAKSKKVKNNIAIVCATTSHFSAITDSLYIDAKEDDRQPKSIVYSDEKIVFYGFESDSMEKLSQVYGLSEDDYYFGGGAGGYFGIKSGKLTPEQMKKMIDVLVKKEAEEIYSSHIFMFPFRFDRIKQDFTREFDLYKNENIKERLDLKKLFEYLNNNGWDYKKFDLSKAFTETKLAYLYNEYAYFYDYAREALYNMCDYETDFEPEKEKEFYDEISYYFELKDFEKNDSVYRIKTRKGDCYQLAIDGISLRIFGTGVGILSIELLNHTYPGLQDVKRINEYGRRIYPQFVGYDHECDAVNTNATKGVFLADSVEIEVSRKDREPLKISESFESVLAKKHYDIRIGQHIIELLGKCFTQDRDAIECFYVQPILDDRMYVVCWYGNDKFSNSLNVDKSYRNSSEWYAFLFVDGGGAMVENKRMKRQLIDEATYERWSGSGTLYGITRYSFMAVTDRGSYGTDAIRTHMQTLYFQMAVLLLANRASILHFSDEVAAIASLLSTEEEERLGDLYGHYLDFYNRLYFKEVTHQDQGIELYDIGIKQMRIVEHIDKLDGKFTKLHDFASLRSNSREGEAMNGLNVLAAVIAPPALVAGLFSLSVFDYSKSWSSLLIVFVLMAFSAFLGYSAIKRWIETKKKGVEVEKSEATGNVLWHILLFIIVFGISLIFFIGKESGVQDVNIKNQTISVKIEKGGTDVNSTK